MAEEPREEAHQGSLLVHLRRCAIASLIRFAASQ
jgi:hypothetical protein